MVRGLQVFESIFGKETTQGAMNQDQCLLSDSGGLKSGIGGEERRAEPLCFLLWTHPPGRWQIEAAISLSTLNLEWKLRLQLAATLSSSLAEDQM